ncbi:conserved hypothetical protein [Rippkaea orientalis PCC 8801]|uniref:Ycf51-like protein n=1 Tax=Rippkaea orientalis (strain PCC 8801 / RF-1) TaxID=41431 RepID=B7K500_RIPO1|nr:Ycf51 family protein [Rippkaea orientalis]ACK66656.1 conserved hypothetical protein [Rippkaea orientalis PCC 8801]
MDILTNLAFSNYIQWSGIATISFLFLTILAFFLGWGIRFRLVGITAFMAVLTGGLFGLGLGLFTRTEIPGAVRFSRVYDNGANQVVIAVPAAITESELEATLKQAATDYFSYGRTAQGGDNNLTIRARVLIHPEPGLSEPLYIGQVKRSLGMRQDENPQIEINQQSLAKLSQNQRSE